MQIKVCPSLVKGQSSKLETLLAQLSNSSLKEEYIVGNCFSFDVTGLDKKGLDESIPQAVSQTLLSV